MPSPMVMLKMLVLNLKWYFEWAFLLANFHWLYIINHWYSVLNFNFDKYNQREIHMILEQVSINCTLEGICLQLVSKYHLKEKDWFVI